MDYPIYHFTDAGNLPSIIQVNKLQAKNALASAFISAAEDSVQDKRARKQIPVPPGGMLHDYVPFYFAPNSPMLYIISRGGVESYKGGQRDLIYLVSTVESVQKEGQCVFTNRNATTFTADFSNDIERLKTAVDWKLMKEKMWNNTPDDQDRKSRRAAEFLVYESVPWNCFHKICVFDEKQKSNVLSMIVGIPYQPVITVSRGWYF